MRHLSRHHGIALRTSTLLMATGIALQAASISTQQWQQANGYRMAKLSPQSGRAGFTLLPLEQTRVFFTNDIPYDRAAANQNLLNGAGVAAGDFDGDGLCDLYFANSGGANKLFRNRGNFQFDDVTAQAGVGCIHQSSKGVVFADINGDGRLDLIVNALGGPNACFTNSGKGRFTDVTAAVGISAKTGSHSLALADVDGDGDLDLYVVNYGENSILRSGGQISVRTVAGKAVVSGRHARRLKIINGQMIELGEPDVLYLNDGKGVFSAVPWTGGAFLDEQGQPLKDAPWDLGLSAVFRDLNDDGAPDLYICNDFQSPDRIWINDGKGHFRALAPEAIRSTSHFSMGVDFADINRDGFDDFFVSDMLRRSHRSRMTQISATNPPAEHVGQDIDRHQIRRNTLHLGRGDGTYAEIANFAGVGASDWSWAVAFLDVDLDGFEDLLVATGHAYDVEDRDTYERGSQKAGVGGGMASGAGRRLDDYPPLLAPNYIFRNRGDLTFEEVGAAWGFNSTNVSHGIALADFDNDGDLDVAVSCLGKPPLLYRNDSFAPRIAVRLRGKAPNVQGIGAKIKVLGGPVPVQSQEIQCGGRYLSADDPVRIFAAGHTTNKLTIEVAWRNGTHSVLRNVEANHIYEVNESSAVFEAPTLTVRNAKVPPLFEDVSGRIAHTHEDPPYDDIGRQPLLSRMLSRLGPGVAWIDLDHDDREELIIGAGKHGRLAVYGSDGKGGFSRRSNGSFAAPMTGDLTSLVGWVSVPNNPVVLAGRSNYEDTRDNEAFVLQFDVAAEPGASSIALNTELALNLSSASVGPLAVGDIDGDGDLDLFVGGRVLPGRYPQPSSSALLRNESGSLKLDAINRHLLGQIGLISGALFSDLSGDGFPELILACEWGPLRMFRNQQGQLTPWNPPVRVLVEHQQSKVPGEALDPGLSTLDQFTGWWNGVTTGDLDGDGRLDIVASNWGLNSSYQINGSGALRLYFGDFDGNGSLDLVESYSEPASQRIVPRRNLGTLGAAMPGLRARFPTHASFSKADVSAILEKHFTSAHVLQVNTLASMAFLNRGDRFEALPLPKEAQFAPAFGVNVADVDGDGHEDVFLSQNFFAMRSEEPRCDAGRGLLLRGNGKGELKAVSGQESGIRIYGEQRGSAWCDFDEDGRVDLVVAQNNAETKLLRNASGKASARVRLVGPPLNPCGIGATIRLRFGERLGPAREFHGGSGYWSQDSSVQIMGVPEAPSAIWIRWPGGNIATLDLPADAREIVTDFRGKLVAPAR